MKQITLALLAAAAAIGQAQPPDSAAALQRQFTAPPAASYRPMPLFVWNGDMTEAEIDRHLAEFQRQGFGGFFIHPRPGLITAYLSDRWFALCRHTLERATKLGLEVWLYDENSYPSGFAGGHVPAEMPESYSEGQGLRWVRTPSGKEECRLLLRRDGDLFAPVESRSGEGEYRCYELAFYPKTPWFAGYSYVDLLKPGVTQKFIEITMKGYERTFGNQLGKTVPGIFTDEPQINAPVRDSMRWTPDLFDQFRMRWGYDLKPLVPALFEEIGDWRKVRHDYYALLLDLVIERWAKPWREYTDSKRMKWTGHYWDHEWPNPNIFPDNMAVYASHQMPGIDLLFNQFDEENGDQFGDARIPRELASVANQLGLPRTLCESYGGGGYELRLEDMKRLGDWQYALGVNFLTPHLSYGTLVGARKYDYPQTFSYHAPWWRHFRNITDYFGRLSLALSAGEQRNRIVVIEPTTTGWMYAGRGAADPRLKAIEHAFRPFLNRLEARQVEYDLASEHILRNHGKASGASLVIGRRSYDLVILPPGLENLERPTFEMLKAYVHAGGKVLSFVDAPIRIDGAATNDVKTLALSAGSADAVPPGEGILAVTGKVLHHRRTLADGELLFFANYSLDAPASAKLSLRRRGVQRLNLKTGEVTPYPSRPEAGVVAFDVELAPGGSILLLASNTEADARPREQPAASIVAPAGPLAINRTEPNVLKIDYCDLKIGGETLPNQYFYRAQEEVYKRFGVGANPWNHAVQYKTAILDRYHFAADSGFEAVFHFRVEPGVDRTAMSAVVERPELWTVSVNGGVVRPRSGASYLDPAFAVYDVGQLVADGANTLTLTARPMSIHHELEPVYLLGNFAVRPADAGFLMAPATPLRVGPWKTQGLPFYWQSVSYRGSWNLTGGLPAIVRLGRWLGTVAEVRVNGKLAGNIGWQPYELDITSSVSDGLNEVEVVVYGSLQSLIGPHHGRQTPGLVAPDSFRHGPASPPPGASYQQLDYGLFEPFTVSQ